MQLQQLSLLERIGFAAPAPWLGVRPPAQQGPIFHDSFGRPFLHWATKNPRGRPVRLRLHPDSETPRQRAERIANRREYASELSEIESLRPRVRSQCDPVRRSLVEHLEPDDPMRVYAPCPFVGCAFHLHLDVGRKGVDKGAIEVFPLSIVNTCVLDVIDSEGESRDDEDCRSREQMGSILQMTDDRTRLIEIELKKKFKEAAMLHGDLAEELHAFVGRGDEADE